MVIFNDDDTYQIEQEFVAHKKAFLSNGEFQELDDLKRHLQSALIIHVSKITIHVSKITLEGKEYDCGFVYTHSGNCIHRTENNVVITWPQ